MLEKGTKAPGFSLKDSSGKVHKLSDYLGKKVVLYFYPKDDTPGCTKEACGFRDDYSAITKKNAVVLGVSADTPESHKKFEDKFDLNFTLLSDPEKKTLEAYQVWGEKSMYGKKFFGIFRITYVIDEKGMIMKVFPKVKPTEHSTEILEVLG